MKEVADSTTDPTEPSTPVTGATDPATPSSDQPTQSQQGGEGNSVVSYGAVSDAQANMDVRPDVSTIVVDKDTGIERIRQGKSMMDMVTRRVVKLSDLGPEYRLAQMFPGVPEEVR